MWLFWLTAFLLACAGLIPWLTSKKIVLWEWLVSASVAFIIAGICQVASIYGMLADQETWSGQILNARYIPAWLEYYEYAVYRTDTHTGTTSDGKGGTTTYTYTTVEFDHWEPATRHHPEEWHKNDNFGRDWNIDVSEYNGFVKVFGKKQAEAGSRSTWDHNSHMISGDANDYVAVNITGWVQPVTIWRSWENRIKAAPSVFSFPPVPATIPVFDYPKNVDPFMSARLLGTAANTISGLNWDQMNSRLGPTKKVNLIAVGFGAKDSSIAEQQRSKWIGGKKNDLVICYGGPDQFRPTWAHVFGWSDSDICKHKLETIVLDNKMGNNIIPLLEAQVRAEYTIKDWHDFDYLTVEPPVKAYYCFFGAIIVIQGGLWVFFYLNEFNKEPA